MLPVRNILDLKKTSSTRFLNAFDDVIIDCEGTLWLLAESIPGTGEAIKEFHRHDYKVNYITNRCVTNPNDFVIRMNAIGVGGVTQKDVVNPVMVITEYYKRKMKKDSTIYSLCSEEVNNVLALAGLNLITMVTSPYLKVDQFVKSITPTAVCEAVLVDINYNLSFGQLARAQLHLEQPNCKLLVAASDHLVPFSKNVQAIGSEGFMNMLSQSTGKTPIILGKGGSFMNAQILNQFGITKMNRVLIIGDDLELDIKFGIALGCLTLFVLTGVSTLDDMKKLPDKSKPDYYAESLADFVTFFQKVDKRQMREEAKAQAQALARYTTAGQTKEN